MKVERLSMYFPKVSIVIPAYNASNYLKEAIESALTQTYANIEVIVINDGSKDDGATEKIALSYGNRIRYYYKENGGSSSALNMGIEKMTGEWFSWLSHDDLYFPEKIEKQLSFLNSLTMKKSEVSRHIFFSSALLIDAKGRIIRPFQKRKEINIAKKVENTLHNAFFIAEPTVYNFNGCSCLIHKDALRDVGMFDESLRLINDLDLWFRLYSKEYIVHYLPIPLVKGRIHSKQISNSIGYSYHNPEQDMFWQRSLNWLFTYHCNEYKLFSLFARNAYLKTRTIEGDKALDNTNISFVGKIMLKTKCLIFVKLKTFAKKIYLLINRHYG